jgi:hypothetical protein
MTCHAEIVQREEEIIFPYFGTTSTWNPLSAPSLLAVPRGAKKRPASWAR